MSGGHPTVEMGHEDGNGEKRKRSFSCNFQDNEFDDNKKRRTRQNLSRDIVEILEAQYQVSPYVSHESCKQVLAEKTGLTPQKIVKWFDNRRSKDRKKKRDEQQRMSSESDLSHSQPSAYARSYAAGAPVAQTKSISLIDVRQANAKPASLNSFSVTSTHPTAKTTNLSAAITAQSSVPNLQQNSMLGSSSSRLFKDMAQKVKAGGPPQSQQQAQQRHAQTVQNSNAPTPNTQHFTQMGGQDKRTHHHDQSQMYGSNVAYGSSYGGNNGNSYPTSSSFVPPHHVINALAAAATSIDILESGTSENYHNSYPNQNQHPTSQPREQYFGSFNFKTEDCGSYNNGHQPDNGTGNGGGGGGTAHWQTDVYTNSKSTLADDLKRVSVTQPQKKRPIRECNHSNYSSDVSSLFSYFESQKQDFRSIFFNAVSDQKIGKFLASPAGFGLRSTDVDCFQLERSIDNIKRCVQFLISNMLSQFENVVLTTHGQDILQLINEKSPQISRIISDCRHSHRPPIDPSAGDPQHQTPYRVFRLMEEIRLTLEGAFTTSAFVDTFNNFIKWVWVYHSIQTKHSVALRLPAQPSPFLSPFCYPLPLFSPSLSYSSSIFQNSAHRSPVLPSPILSSPILPPPLLSPSFTLFSKKNSPSIKI